MDWKAGLDNAFSDVFSRRNLLRLALFWGLSFGLVVVYGTLAGRLSGPSACAPDVPDTVATNETGIFSARRDTGPQGAFEVTFGNLRAENGASGIFRTAAHKCVYIDHLEVTFRRSSPNDNDAFKAFRDLFAPRRRMTGTAMMPLGILDEVQAQTTGWSIPVDLANATEVRIAGLNLKVRCGEDVVLRVCCKHALLTASDPQVLLRGHATVMTPRATLQSNYIEMDMRKGCFVVEGRYVLTETARTRTGSGARFDRALRPLDQARFHAREDEQWTRGLSLGVF